MDIMESIEVIKLYNRNIERSHSFLLNVLDQTIQNNVHSEALETNRNHLSIAHLNTQSMSSTFDEPQVMVRNILLILLHYQKLGYETIQSYYSTYKYQDIVSVIKTGTDDEEVVSEGT